MNDLTVARCRKALAAAAVLIGQLVAVQVVPDEYVGWAVKIGAVLALLAVFGVENEPMPVKPSPESDPAL
jgi:hypothetical protein